MPARTYCYKTKSGERFERIYQPGKAPDEVNIGKNGYSVRAYRDRQAEVFGLVTSVRSGENTTRLRRRNNPWPMDPCVGSGVGPHGAQDLRDHFATHDVPTEVSKDGEPIYTSAKHRKKALKCRGMYDRTAYS
jgi:hypothetical protein